MTNTIKPHYQDILMTIIRAHLPACRIYLFGSRARGTNRPGADVDLALDAGEKIPMKIIFAIKSDIEESTIPILVDVIDLATTTESFQEEVARDGVLWTD